MTPYLSFFFITTLMTLIGFFLLRLRHSWAYLVALVLFIGYHVLRDTYGLHLAPNVIEMRTLLRILATLLSIGIYTLYARPRRNRAPATN